MTVVHHVFANRSNAGDWLSALGIQRLLPGAIVEEHLCDAPFVEETLRRIAQATRDDLILIGGGGLFSDYFMTFWKRLLKLDLGAPIVLWGVGCCDRKLGPSLPDNLLMREVARRSRLCVVRDQLTGDFLGEGAGNVQVVPCPTMVALSGRSSSGQAVMHVDHYDNIGEKNFYAIKSLCDEHARATGVKSLWTNNILPAGQKAKLDAIVDLYCSSRLVVSSRLHGCIIGLSLGCKVLAVSGDRKVESFMKAAGLAEWVCDIGDVSGLGDMLRRLDRQPSADAFVAQVRADNEEVAGAVQKMIGPCGRDHAP